MWYGVIPPARGGRGEWNVRTILERDVEKFEKRMYVRAELI